MKNTDRKNSSTKDKPSNYLQSRILILILFFITVIGILVTTMSSYLYKHYLQKALLQSAESNLQFLADNIDTSIEGIKRLISFTQNNNTLCKFAEQGKSSRPLSLQAYNRLSEEYYASVSQEYMMRILLASNTGSYLQIISNAYSNSKSAYLMAQELPYYSTLLESADYDFTTGFVKDGFYTGKVHTSVLPVLRPITARYNAAYCGWILIYISENLFTDPLAYYSLPTDSQIYLALGDHNYLLTQEGCQEVTEKYELSPMTGTGFLGDNTKAYYMIDSETGKSSMTISKSFSQMENCYISQTISPRDLNTRRTLFLTTVACIILLIVVMGMIVSYLLYRSISIPVLKLRDKIDRVAEGDFSKDTTIEWNHELGDIGRGINHMSGNIEDLLNRRIEDEKQKRDLEYKMLQSQINPHFIHNTLNSIKWMATIQGADGIAEMTTSLSRLLKSISKGTSLLVPIREELALLQDYFTIQQYRYGGTITLQISVLDEALYECMIVKFTLQPLVENAIFHGIEPKGAAGVIEVIVSDHKDGDIQIVVADNGVGMSPEKAVRLLTDGDDSPAEFFREIGVSNVHKRLRYEFGEKYGITIETREGEYTRMILLLPRRTG